MLEVVIRRVRPDRVDELRRWMAELEARRDEVLESFQQVGTRQEKALLITEGSEPLLVYVMDADDPDAANVAYQASSLPIDIDHRRVMSEVLQGPASFEVLYKLP